jgi:dTDP-4-amino-4,6-dideoxygalactose transaminase
VRSEYLPFGQPDFGAGEIEAVSRVLSSGWVGMGPETVKFEEELAAYVGAPHVVTVDSCTSALFLSLACLGIGPGDEVICPSLTWCATLNAILYLGATPVLCEVDPGSLCVTPDTIRPHLTSKTRAVIGVHFGGYAIDVEGLRRSLPDSVEVVEDAAHALGSRYPGGGPVGGSGNLVCFSFYANKNLSTAEGGAIALADGTVADRLRSLRQNAFPRDAWRRFSDPRTLILTGPSELGYKMNYTDLHAAIGRVQLRRQGEFATRRLEIARVYAGILGGSGSGVIWQERVLEPDHARHLMVVTLPRGSSRDLVLGGLRERNIGATLHYAPLHRMDLYARWARVPLPKTDDLGMRILTLPIGARMSIVDAREAASVFLEVCQGLPPAVGSAR